MIVRGSAVGQNVRSLLDRIGHAGLGKTANATPHPPDWKAS
jgi:hypothetical protein